MATKTIDTYAVTFQTKGAATAARNLASALGTLATAVGKFKGIPKITPLNAQQIQQTVAAVRQFNQVMAQATIMSPQQAIAFKNQAQAMYLMAKAANVQAAAQAKANAQNKHQIGGLRTLGAEHKKAAQGILVDWASVGRFLQANITTRLLYAMAAKIKESVGEAAELNRRLAEIQTISLKAGGFGPTKLISELKTGFYNLSNQLGIPQIDLIEAQYQAVSNQVQGAAESFGFLETAAKYSKIAVTSAAGGVSLLSAAIHAFNLSSAQSEAIAAKMFKTIELGRLRSADLEQDYGRSAVIAHQLGISLDELNAAFTVITTQGIKFANSQTYLNNIMLKLVKPTEKMSDTLNSMGIVSGEMGIEVFGLIGLLERLSDVVNRSLDPMGELGETFGTIRAITGATVFMNEEVQQRYIKNLRDIANAQTNYATAFETMMENSGAIILKEGVKIKNFFLSEVGGNIVEFLRRVNNSIYKLSDIFILGTSGILSFLGALGVLKLTMTGITHATTAAGAGLVKYTVTEHEAALATRAANDELQRQYVQLGFVTQEAYRSSYAMVRLKEGALAFASGAAAIGSSIALLFLLSKTWGRDYGRTLESFENLAAETRRQMDLNFKAATGGFVRLSNDTAIAMKVINQAVNSELADQRAKMLRDISASGQRLVALKDTIANFSEEQLIEFKVQDRILKAFKSEITDISDYFKSIGKEFRADTEAAARFVEQMVSNRGEMAAFADNMANADIVNSLAEMVDKYSVRLDAFTDEHRERIDAMLAGLEDTGTHPEWVEAQRTAINESIDQAYDYRDQMLDILQAIDEGYMSPIEGRKLTVEIENRFTEKMSDVTQQVERLTNRNRESTEGMKEFGESLNAGLAEAKKLFDKFSKSGGLNGAAQRVLYQQNEKVLRQLHAGYASFGYDPTPQLMETLRDEVLSNMMRAAEFEEKMKKAIEDRGPKVKDTRSYKAWESEADLAYENIAVLEQQIADIGSGRISTEQAILTYLDDQLAVMTRQQQVAEKIKISSEEQEKFKAQITKTQDLITKSNQESFDIASRMARLTEGSKEARESTSLWSTVKGAGPVGAITGFSLVNLLKSVSPAVAVPAAIVAAIGGAYAHQRRRENVDLVWNQIESRFDELDQVFSVLQDPGATADVYEAAGLRANEMIVAAIEGLRTDFGVLDPYLAGTTISPILKAIQDQINTTQDQEEKDKLRALEIQFSKADRLFGTEELYRTSSGELKNALSSIILALDSFSSSLNIPEEELAAIRRNLQESLRQYTLVVEGGGTALEGELVKLAQSLSPEKVGSIYTLRQAAEDARLGFVEQSELFSKMVAGSKLLADMSPEDFLNKLEGPEGEEFLRQVGREFMDNTEKLDDTLENFTDKMELITERLGHLDFMQKTMSLPTDTEGGGAPEIKSASGGIIPNRPNMRKPIGTDSVMAALTPGEFVVRRDAVQKYGLSMLQMINSGMMPVKRFASGGSVQVAGDGWLLVPGIGWVREEDYMGYEGYGGWQPRRKRPGGARIYNAGYVPQRSAFIANAQYARPRTQTEGLASSGIVNDNGVLRSAHLVARRQDQNVLDPDAEILAEVNRRRLARLAPASLPGLKAVATELSELSRAREEKEKRFVVDYGPSTLPVLRSRHLAGKDIKDRVVPNLTDEARFEQQVYALMAKGAESQRRHDAWKKRKEEEREIEPQKNNKDRVRREIENISRQTVNTAQAGSSYPEPLTKEQKLFLEYSIWGGLRRAGENEEVYYYRKMRELYRIDDPIGATIQRGRTGKSWDDWVKEKGLDRTKYKAGTTMAKNLNDIYTRYKPEIEKKIKESDRTVLGLDVGTYNVLYDTDTGDLIRRIFFPDLPEIRVPSEIPIDMLPGDTLKTLARSFREFQLWKEHVDEDYLDYGFLWSKIKDFIPFFATGGSVLPSYSVQNPSAGGYTSNDTITFNLDAKNLNPNEIADSVMQRMIHMRRSKHPQAARLFNG